MTGMKKWVVSVAFVFAHVLVANAQTDTAANKNVNNNLSLKRTFPQKKDVIKKPKPIRTEFSGGFRLNSDGWSIFADKGWVSSQDKQSDYFYDVKVLEFELSEKKNAREIKSTNNITLPSSGDHPKSFIYGKVNNFYTFKVGYGMRKMIAGKPEIKTVSIHWVYLGGLSMGMLKPYYLDVVTKDRIIVKGMKYRYDDSISEEFLNRNNIIGYSGFSKGLNELKIVPGIYAKTALHFDFHSNKTRIIAIETGASVEYYAKKIEMMAIIDPVPYFVNIYASIQFGKRWQ